MADADESPDYTDADWLREQYYGQGKSMAAIGEACGVNNSTIQRWMDRHGIERRDRGRAIVLAKHSDDAVDAALDGGDD